MAIVDLHRSDVETDIEGGVEFSFSKDAASKLYQMMSNYLYSDKEYAVISELSANAIDAHALVGKKDTPIAVQLPTRLDSEFVVRDAGPGLSEADVYRFLTSYGESSKGDSNEQIGFWGIGAKSPAAVSDTWSVISHHDGRKTHYEVFITETGIPTLKKIFEGETTETGLEVRVPVPLNNHGQWRTAARRAFKHYEVKPAINEELSYPEITVVNQGTGWRQNSKTNRGGKLIITMREYQLDYIKVMGEVDITSHLRNLFSSADFANMDFVFGVGEINLSISREQIQYDKKTMDSIKARLELAYKELKALVTNDLALATDSLDYRVRLNKWFTDGVGQTFLLHIVNGKYGITSLPRDITKISSPQHVDVLKDHMQVISNGRLKKVSSSFSCWGTNLITLDSLWNSTKQEYDRNLGLNIQHLDKIQVVIRDVRNAVSRIKYDGDDKKYYLLVDKSPFGAEVKTVLASSFEKAPIDYKKNERGAASGFYKMDRNRFLKIDAKQYSQYAAIPQTVAVKIINATTAGGESTVTDPKIQFLIKQGWHVVGYKDSAPKGIKLPDRALQWLFDEMKADAELKTMIEDQAVRHMFKQVGGNNTALIAAKTDIDSDKWKELVAPMQPVRDYFMKNKASMPGSYAPSKFNTWCKLCEILGKDDKTSGVVDLSSMINTLNERYPLLSYMNQRWYGEEISDLDAVIDYIKMVDNKI